MLKWKPGRRARQWLAVLSVPLAACMLLRWFEHQQIFHPDPLHGSSPEVLGRPYEDFYFGDSPRLHGWFFPASPESPREHLAVLVCHGNGGNISHRLDQCDKLLRFGVNVLLFDYRGYGKSGGKPDEEGTYRDAQTAYQWLHKKGFSEKHIVVLGEAQGGAIATELALREPVGGLILQSTFTSIPDIGAEIFTWLPVRRLCTIYYDTLSKLPRLNIPVAVMHSRDDRLIGFHHAEKNFAAANEPKLFWELKGGHNETLAAGKMEYIQGLEKFFSVLENRPQLQTK